MNVRRVTVPVVFIVILMMLGTFATATTVAVSFSPTNQSGQAADIEQGTVYTWISSLFSTGYQAKAVIPSGQGTIYYTANLTAPSTSVSEIQIESSSGQILSTAKGNGWSVSDSFDFTFSGYSEYIMYLYYSQSNVGSSIATTSNGVVAESSDGFTYALSTNTQYSGVVYTTTQNITSSTLQAVVTITEKTTTPPPSDATISFMESGLPTGTAWSVTYHSVLNGYTGANASLSSTTDEIQLTMAIGNTIYYWISDYGTLIPSPSEGILNLVSNTTVNVVYPTPQAKSYSVTFVPVGLPSGTTWGVTLAGLELYGSSLNGQNPDISFAEVNGSYSYSIYMPSPETASPSSGSITVSGSAVTQDITVNVPVKDYTLSFTGSGLPSGTYFTVSTGVGSASGNPTASFTVPNGTYSYTIADVSSNGQTYIPSPNAGTVTISGSSRTVSITFTTQSFIVSVPESGLPSGTMWYMNLTNGQHFSTSSSLLTFDEPAGTYLYSLAAGNASYAPSSVSGSFTVSSSNIIVSVVFVENIYSVTFNESGLPSGTLWGVTFGTKSATSSASAITFPGVLQGTYAWVAMSDGYNNVYGNLTVTASSPRSIFVSGTFESGTIITGPPSVTITSSQDYFINGTVQQPSQYVQSDWTSLYVVISSQSYEKSYTHTPPDWNFSFQVPNLNTTYSLSFRLTGKIQLTGQALTSQYYNTSVKMPPLTSGSNIPTYYDIFPSSGTTIYSNTDVGLFLKGSVVYSGILSYSSPLAYRNYITLQSKSLGNGTQSLYYQLNISGIPSGSYNFKFVVQYQNKTLAAFTAQYYIDSVNVLTLKYDYNYTTVGSLYDTFWNISEVDNSSQMYSVINVLNVSYAGKEIGFITGHPFSSNGKTRDYFTFEISNLSRGSYNLTITAFNRTGNLETPLFSTNYNFTVPSLAPTITGGFSWPTVKNWLQQGYNEYYVAGIGAVIIIGAIAAYSSGSFKGSRTTSSQGSSQSQQRSQGINIRVNNYTSKAKKSAGRARRPRK
jgi:hypothetical protein